MQFVQFFQVSDCRDLQEIEIIFAGVAKIGGRRERGRNVCYRSHRYCCAAASSSAKRTHMHLLWLEKSWAPPKGRERLTSRFRSANFSGAILFRSCTASGLRAGDVGAAVGDVHDAIAHAVDVPYRGSRLARQGRCRIAVRHLARAISMIRLASWLGSRGRLGWLVMQAFHLDA
jgi:predicted secreted protein